MESDADELRESNGDVLAMVATQKRVRIDGRKKPKRGRKKAKIGILGEVWVCRWEEKLVIVV